MNKGVYFLFLTVFILYVAFAAIPSDEVYVYWYPLYPDMRITVQTYMWIAFLRIAVLLIFVAWYYESRPENRHMIKILMYIHAWYVVEYFLHYTSVWITWKQLGLSGNHYDGISSHLVTMGCFAYFAWRD